MVDFPGTFEYVTFDFRLKIPVADAEKSVRKLERLAKRHGWDLDFPPGDGLPYEHILTTGADNES